MVRSSQFRPPVPPRVLALVAGEASGDYAGRRVIRCAQASDPDGSALLGMAARGAGGRYADGSCRLEPPVGNGAGRSAGSPPRVAADSHQSLVSYLKRRSRTVYRGSIAPDFTLNVEKQLREGGIHGSLCQPSVLRPAEKRVVGYPRIDRS